MASRVRNLFVSVSGRATRPIQRELHPEDAIAAADLMVHNQFTKHRRGPNARHGRLFTMPEMAGTQVRGRGKHLRSGDINPPDSTKFI